MALADLQDRLDALRDLFVDGSPHAVALGMKATAWTPQAATIELPYHDDLVGDPGSGVIHGGAVSALLDHTSGMAAFAALGGEAPVATLDLRIDYMRPSTPGAALRADAKPRQVMNLIAYVEATAHNGDPNDPVAMAVASFVVPRSYVEQANRWRQALAEDEGRS